MQTILILQGVPGAGKSTFAKEWKETSPETRIVVNRDTIRKELNCFPIGNYIQEINVSEQEVKEIVEAIKNQKDVCIDATNLNEKTLKKWTKLASDLNVKIEKKEFVISMKEALKRDKIREKPVGKRCIFSFYERYYPEMFKEYFTDKRLLFKQKENHLYENAIICDLDGTLALHNGRNPYDETKIYTDEINLNLKKLLKSLSRNYRILFVSGRKESSRQATENWLTENFTNLQNIEWKLYMRKSNDFRKDAIIKEEIYKNYIETEYNVIAVFDDRNQCVDMWRNLGLMCCQVYYGDF